MSGHDLDICLQLLKTCCDIRCDICLMTQDFEHKHLPKGARHLGPTQEVGVGCLIARARGSRAAALVATAQLTYGKL